MAYTGVVVARIIEDLIHRLDQLVDGQDWQSAHEAALALWQYPAYQEEIADGESCNDYVRALFKVADLFQHVGHSPYDALAPLKRAYALDDGRLFEGGDYSGKEAAAYKLGHLYDQARCHHSAVEWFRRAYVLAQEVGVANNILRNLYCLGSNLETLARYEEAGRYYDKMLEMLSSMKVEQHPYWLVPAAMYQIHHGDPVRGERLMHSLIAATLGQSISPHAGKEQLQDWFLAALRALGMHYIATGRPQEAIELARIVGKRAKRFDKSGWARGVKQGLTARAFVHMGRLEDAMAELAQVFDLEQTTFMTYMSLSTDFPLETVELLGDIARIHAAHRRYDRAMSAYAILAYHLGGYIANWRVADTNRLRFYWLQQQALVVHEMVSVWLTIPDEETRQATVATVANSLLQLKANLFIAMEVHRLDTLKYSTGDTIFWANRRYVAAARRMLMAPDDQAAILELEEELFHREEIERSLLTADMIPIPGMAGILNFDFRESSEIGEGELLLDYSLIRYRPPQNGLTGSPQGLRYVGVRLATGDLKMVDLGDAQPIEALCQLFIQAVSREPSASHQFHNDHQDSRNLIPVKTEAENAVDLDQLSERVYRSYRRALRAAHTFLVVFSGRAACGDPFPRARSGESLSSRGSRYRLLPLVAAERIPIKPATYSGKAGRP